MMYAIQHMKQTLVVLRISPDVLDLPGTVITDGNAASYITRFYPSPAGLEALNQEEVFAQWWTDADYFRQEEKKRKRCAEVLVPEAISPNYFLGCYACNDASVLDCLASAPWLRAEVKGYVFF
jgi:hypothetical protein